MNHTFKISTRPIGKKYLAEVALEKPGDQRDGPYWEVIGAGLAETEPLARKQAVEESGILETLTGNATSPSLPWSPYDR